MAHRVLCALLFVRFVCASPVPLCPSPGNFTAPVSITLPANYPASQDCVATLSVITGFVQGTVNAFGTEANSDFLYVYDGPSTASPLLGKYSGSPGLPLCIISTGISLTVRFKSDYSITGSGFAIDFVPAVGNGYYTMAPQYSKVPLSDTLIATSTPQRLSDRYTPCSSKYLDSTSTMRQIAASSTDQHVLLTLSSFASENNCDFLRVYDTYGTAVAIAAVTGVVGNTNVPQLPLCFASGSNAMTLLWESDLSVTAAGWIATFESVTLGYDLMCSVNRVLNATSGVLRDRYHGSCHGLYVTGSWAACTRQIVAPSSAWRVRVTFTEYSADSSQKLYLDDNLFMLQGQLPAPIILPYCFVSSTPSLTVELDTNPYVTSQSAGWQLQWDLVPAPSYEVACAASSLSGVPIVATSGTMKDRYSSSCSPVYYPSYGACQRLIQAPVDQVVLVRLTQFEVVSGYLTFSDPLGSWWITVSGNASQIDSFHGLRSIESCFAVSTNLTVEWERQDSAVSSLGWSLDWLAVPQPSYETICGSSAPLTTPGSLSSHYGDISACAARYPALQSCLRTVIAPVGQVVRITAVSLNAPGSDLRIFDGYVARPSSGTYPPTGVDLGNSVNTPACVFLSTSNVVTITWDASPWSSKYFAEGWNLSYSFAAPPLSAGLFCGATTQPITAPSGTISDRPSGATCQRGLLPNYECGTSFTAPDGYIVRFLLVSYVANSWGDYLRLYDGSMGTTFAQLLSFRNNDRICMQTSGSSAHLHYIIGTDTSTTNKGWVANWTFVPNSTLTADYAIDFCSSSAAITTGPGYINSQGTSRVCLGAYSTSKTCTRLITAPLQGIVNFTLLSLSTESGYDVLRIYDGPSGPLLLERSGLVTLPVTVASTGRNLFVSFRSDSAVIGVGWQAYYSFAMPTNTPTPSPSPSPTLSPSPTSTGPVTLTSSWSPTRSVTLTATATKTHGVVAPTSSCTPSPSPTSSPSLSPTRSKTASHSGTSSATLSQTRWALSHSSTSTSSTTQSRSPSPTSSPSLHRGRPWQLERCEDAALLADGQTCWCWEGHTIDCRGKYFEPWVDETNPSTLQEWNLLRRSLDV
eukprot:TRINITY_DN19572_c0_g1_i1.p1 TRINITY_DN19572_c0_g1~~TRINITY_DN19572_c0_g1_i1.p1  ORF type:complete len:1096 (+),score=84.89 TRINITY_DN19572_c0_g1_i1:26-3289(+)